MATAVGVTRREATGVLLVSIVAPLAKADSAVIGVLAPSLRADFHLDDVRLGLLASIASGTGALCALPAGGLVDRHRRALVLTLALVGWSLALGLAGLATGFALFAVARLVSGGVATVARPAAVSLIGDTYPASDRGRVMARLDAGQTAGTAVCFGIGALCTRFLDWRWAFWWLAAVGLALAVFSARSEEPVGRRPPGPPLWPALRTLVRIPTNVVVVVADGLGTFFYAGVTSFAVLFAMYRYGLSASVVDALAPLVGVAVIAGVLTGGRVGDRLFRRSGGSQRLILACGCDLVAVVLLVPAIVVRSAGASVVLLFLAAASLGASGPCLDAVRLDVVPPSIRGRSEASRGLLVLAGSTLGPVVFGELATVLGGGGQQGPGLRDAFLVMLVPLAAAGIVLLAGLRSYELDAAAARSPGGWAPPGAEGLERPGPESPQGGERAHHRRHIRG